MVGGVVWLVALERRILLMHFTAFQAGTEPFTGSGKLEVSQYIAAVN